MVQNENTTRQQFLVEWWSNRVNPPIHRHPDQDEVARGRRTQETVVVSAGERTGRRMVGYCPDDSCCPAPEDDDVRYSGSVPERCVVSRRLPGRAGLLGPGATGSGRHRRRSWSRWWHRWPKLAPHSQAFAWTMKVHRRGRTALPPPDHGRRQEPGQCGPGRRRASAQTVPTSAQPGPEPAPVRGQGDGKNMSCRPVRQGGRLTATTEKAVSRPTDSASSSELSPSVHRPKIRNATPRRSTGQQASPTVAPDRGQ